MSEQTKEHDEMLTEKDKGEIEKALVKQINQMKKKEEAIKFLTSFGFLSKSGKVKRQFKQA